MDRRVIMEIRRINIRALLDKEFQDFETLFFQSNVHPIRVFIVQTLGLFLKGVREFMNGLPEIETVNK